MPFDTYCKWHVIDFQGRVKIYKSNTGSNCKFQAAMLLEDNLLPSL